MSVDDRSVYYLKLAKRLMPGPDYVAHLLMLHSLIRPDTYIEIGVAKGRTLGLASPLTRSIGIDPAPCLDSPSTESARLFVMTSDMFFKHTASSVLSNLCRASLSFIDGFHSFEQVLTDFINIEAHSAPGGIVAIHDTLPVSKSAAARQRNTDYWCGDVWKIVFCLKTFRPDLRILTLPCFPSGLTLVSNLDPENTELRNQWSSAISQCSVLPYYVYRDHFKSILANVPNQLPVDLLLSPCT